MVRKKDNAIVVHVLVLVDVSEVSVVRVCG